GRFGKRTERQRLLHAAAVLNARARPDAAPACGAEPADRWDPIQREVCGKLDDDTRRDLRRSLRCACGEWRNARGREVAQESDPGEQLLAAMEKATRLRQTTCPWQALRDPFTIEVLRAHRWWKERQLEAMYAGAVPEAVRRGVDV